MTNEELQVENERTRARLAGEEISLRFMKRHITDFDRSPESSQKIADYMKEQSLAFTDENLEKSFQALRAQGVTFTTSRPEGFGEHLLENLPEVPGMSPKIFTMSDINRMDPERYKKLYFGPHAAEFRARTNEIIRRAKLHAEGN
jgi:hypothetical protein